MKENENVGLLPIIVDYLRHWKLILGTGLFSLIVAILYLVLYPKTYEAMARVQIQDDNGMMSSGSMALGDAAGIMKSFGIGGVGSGTISIENEISVFQSNKLLSDVVVKLHLYSEYSHPFKFWFKMYGEEPVKVVCDSTTIANLEEAVSFKLSVSDGGKVKIKSKTLNGKQTFYFDQLPAVVELKEGRFTFVRSHVDQRESSYKVNIDVYPPSWVAEDLSNDMNIEDYSKTADIIEFTYADHQKERAIDIMNTLIDLYNIEAFKYKDKLANASETFLDERISGIMKELSLVEHRIGDYKTINKITDVLYDVQYYSEYMKELNIKMIEAETEANMIKLMDEFIKNPENKYKLVPSLFATGQDSEGSPLFVYNQTLLERERIIKSSTENNPLVETLTSQADRLRESVFQMIENAQKSASQTRTDLINRENQLIKRMGEVPEQERVYVDLKRQQEILQGVYLILLQKREEIALTLGQSIDKAKIIDNAYVLKKPVAPRKLYAVFIFVILTLALSIGWLFCKKQFLDIWNLLKKTN